MKQMDAVNGRSAAGLPREQEVAGSNPARRTNPKFFKRLCGSSNRYHVLTTFCCRSKRSRAAAAGLENIGAVRNNSVRSDSHLQVTTMSGLWDPVVDAET